MFEMGGKGSVSAAYGPVVFAVKGNAPGADVDHGFNADDHSSAQQRGSSGTTEIRDFRFFMHFFTAAMSDQVSHHAETGLFDDLFDGAADVIDAIAVKCRSDSGEEGLFGDCQQAGCLSGSGDSSANGTGIVTGVAAQGYPDIKADQITLSDDPVGSSNAMNDFIIDGNTDLSREAIVSKKRAFSAGFPDEAFREVIEVGAAQARADCFAEFLQHHGRGSSSCFDAFDFCFLVKHNVFSFRGQKPAVTRPRALKPQNLP